MEYVYMVFSTSYDHFKRDILDLYCKTKHGSIEDLFIRFADAKDADFCQWIIKNQKSLREHVKDPRVVAALVSLSELRYKMSMGEKIDRGYIVTELLSSNERRNSIPVMLTFQNLLSEAKMADILSQFSDIIQNIFVAIKLSPSKKDPEQVAEEKTRIFDNLVTIQNAYVSAQEGTQKEFGVVKRPSVAKQKKDMLKNLIIRFSREIALAFDSHGLQDVADKIREGILVKPPDVGIGKIFPSLSISSSDIYAIQELVNSVWKNSDFRWTNYNHDIIETTLMNRAGEISNEELYALRSKYEEQRDVSTYLEDSETMFSDMGLDSPAFVDKRINPSYLFMLSSFFVQMQIKMKIPIY